MHTCQCAGCDLQFQYNPSRPTQQYHSTACRESSKRKRRSNESHNGARSKTRDDHDVEFIAVDGEGVTRMEYVEVWDDDEQNFVHKLRKVHHYVVISVGDETLHHDGALLRHDEIFSFLYQQKIEHPNAAFVGFYLGYDFSQWLKSLPAGRGDALFHPYGIQRRMPRNKDLKYPFPVTIDNRWDIDFLGLKRMKLRPHVPRKLYPECDKTHTTLNQIEECAAGRHKKHPHKWMYINDAGPFFQTSLMVAINPKKWRPGTEIVSPAEMELLQEGKDARADAEFTPQMIRYNLLENDVLARLMRTVNQGFVADGIKLRTDQWYGPGQAAQAWMRNIGAPTGDAIREVVPFWAIDAARMSYYGGWFETFVNGVIPDTVHSYDINSAYPYAIESLPCLLHGEWTRGEGKPGYLKKGHLRLLNASFVGKDPYIGTMPHRDSHGGISRPARTAGWHWQHEVDAAKAAGMLATTHVDEWIEYKPCGCKKPFAAIRELYEGRIDAGKDTPYGMSKKLVYNSAYGKMAQSIGVPKYSNSIYASLITSHCRTMIIRAIATHPDKTKAVAMVATDGIVFLTPHPDHKAMVHKTELGKWGYKEHHNLSILMPGLYWDDESRQSIRDGENLKLKSRGVSGKYLAPFIDQFDAEWRDLWEFLTKEGGTGHMDLAPKISIKVEFGVISPRLAVARNNWYQCGQVVWDDDRVISANPQGKRGVFYPDGPILRTRRRTRVHDSKGIPMERSAPYVNRFGADPYAELRAIAERSDLLTQEGTVEDIVRAVVP